MPDKIRNRKGEKKFNPVMSKAVNRSSVYTETKICQRCGQIFQRRKKWADDKDWAQINYCSKKC